MRKGERDPTRADFATRANEWRLSAFTAGSANGDYEGAFLPLQIDEKYKDVL
jgi:hypothetical protein